MATPEHFEQLASAVEKNLETIEGFDLDLIIREKELGNQLSFKEAQSLIIKIFELFKSVNNIQIREIPYNLLNHFNSQVQNFLEVIANILSYDPNINEPVTVRDSLIEQLRNRYDSYYEHTLPILTIGLLEGNDLSVQKAKLDSLVEEYAKKQKETDKISQKHLKDLQETLKNAEAAAAQVGVSKHSTIFKIESDNHLIEAGKWLKRTIYILIATAIISIVLLFLSPSETNNINKVIQFALTKIIILSTLFYGLSICARNYKAHKHNSLINQHRQNALTTFETFSKAAGTDQQTKNAVLLEATHTIFSNQQTGYLNSEKEGESSNKFVEIIKSVANKSGEE